MLGLERAKREGKHLGRPKGKKDTKRRRRSGYFYAGVNNHPPKTTGMISIVQVIDNKQSHDSQMDHIINKALALNLAEN